MGSQFKRPQFNCAHWGKSRSKTGSFEDYQHASYHIDILLQFSDWYQVTRRDVEAAGGQTLFSGYRSLPQVLLNTYPDFPWDILAFCDRGPWRDKSLLIKALDQAEQRLGVVRVGNYQLIQISEFNH